MFSKINSALIHALNVFQDMLNHSTTGIRRHSASEIKLGVVEELFNIKKDQFVNFPGPGKEMECIAAQTKEDVLNCLLNDLTDVKSVHDANIIMQERVPKSSLYRCQLIEVLFDALFSEDVTHEDCDLSSFYVKLVKNCTRFIIQHRDTDDPLLQESIELVTRFQSVIDLTSRDEVVNDQEYHGTWMAFITFLLNMIVLGRGTVK